LPAVKCENEGIDEMELALVKELGEWEDAEGV
jgi:hypothetical protein